MKNFKTQNNKDDSYGIRYSKSGSNIIIEDYFSNLSMKLPLGETLFTIIEAVDMLNDIAINKNNEHINSSAKAKYKHEKIEKYFSNKRYNLCELFYNFKIDIDEINRLHKIIDFINLCINNDSCCNIKYLESLALGIFNTQDEIQALFSTISSLRIRQLRSNVKLPFFLSTKDLIDNLNKQYSEFSFYSFTHFKRLSEICVLSLYEIFNLNLIICKCKMCNHYFVGNRLTKFCKRELVENDFQGCKKYRVFLDTQKINNNDYIKTYKKVYQRLFNRAKKNTKTDIINFDFFKKEWKILRKQISEGNKNESDIIKFLNSERWN